MRVGFRERETHTERYERTANTLSLAQARKAVVVLARALRHALRGLADIDRSGPHTIWDMTHRQHKVVDFGDVNRVMTPVIRETAIPPAPRDPQGDPATAFLERVAALTADGEERDGETFVMEVTTR